MTTQTTPHLSPPHLRTSGSSGPIASLNGSSPVGGFLTRLISAPPRSRVAMAMAEASASVDASAQAGPAVVAVGSVDAGTRLGQAAVALAALWGRWGRPTCLIDLCSGPAVLGGAITSSDPDLAAACNQAESGETLTTLSRLHASVPAAAVIAAGKADVLGLISTGRLAALVASLKKNHDRVVLVTPLMNAGFPFLSLNSMCDRLALVVDRGRSRGGPLREVAEQALRAGTRPIDVIWFD